MKDQQKPPASLADKPLDIASIRTIVQAYRKWVEAGKPYKR